MATRAFLLAALLLASGVAAAGSPASPDIEDPALDLALAGPAGIPAPEVDLRAVWWTVEDGTARVSFRVEDLSRRTLLDEALHYGLRGRTREYATVEVAARHVPTAPPEWQWVFTVAGCNPGPCDGLLAEGTVDEAANVVTVAFPASFFRSDVECTSAIAVLSARSGSGYGGGGPFWLRDHAPNDLACGPALAVT